MKKAQETYYVSDDGRRFNNEEDCLKWENRKHFMCIQNLTDEQIFKLFNIIFYFFDHTDYKIELHLRHDHNENTGFDFKLKYTDINTFEKEKIEGSIFGYNEVYINIRGYGHSWYSIKEVYEYLESIGYFKEYEKEPPKNGNYSWHEFKQFQKKSEYSD